MNHRCFFRCRGRRFVMFRSFFYFVCENPGCRREFLVPVSFFVKEEPIADFLSKFVEDLMRPNECRAALRL